MPDSSPLLFSAAGVESVAVLLLFTLGSYPGSVVPWVTPESKIELRMLSLSSPDEDHGRSSR